MANQYNNPIKVPICIDAIWSDGKTTLAPPTVQFGPLPETTFRSLPGTTSSDGNFSNSSPWLGDTVRPPSNISLDPGLHLHWTLPQALRRGVTVYMLVPRVYNELVQQGVPVSLVQALQQKASDGKELTLDDLNNLLKSLAPSSTFSPLTSKDFQITTTPPAEPPAIQGLISSDTNVSAYALAPTLTWDPISLQLYGPLIVRAAARVKLPPVPNRWLVVREGGTGDPTAWVVESDRLSTPKDDVGNPPDGAGPATVPGQFSSPLPDPVTGSQTFQFLGLKTQASDWSERVSPDPATIFSPLTAVGHGVPEFAAFYPNCQGVFGSHDKTADDPNTQYTYTVIGWFSDPANDPASSQYAVTPWSAETDPTKQMVDKAYHITNLGWNVEGKPDWSQIDGSLYTAKIAVKGTDCQIQNPDLTQVKVAIGNTAGQALAAYLKNVSDVKSALGLTAETLLDAAQAGVLRRALDPDGPAVIENALHQQAFQAIAGGWLWQIGLPAPKDPGLSTDPPAVQPPLPDNVAKALNDLNSAQMQFDRTQAYLKAQRQLLFTDWCRALHLATDASSGDLSGSTSSQANVEQISFLAGDLVNQTAQAVDTAGMGLPYYAVDKISSYQPEKMLGYNAGQALYLRYAAVAGALVGSGYVLKQQPAPRFWRPNDPVVLMCDEDSGELQPKTACPLDDSQGLPCSVLSPATQAPPYLPGSWSTGPSADCIAAVVGDGKPPPAAVQSWRPLLLQWEAQYCPYPGVGKIEADNGSYKVIPYSNDFISANFSPNPEGIELTTQLEPNLTGTHPDYTGRVVLSNHAIETLKDRIQQLAGQDVGDLQSTLAATLGPDAAKLLADAHLQGIQTLSQTLDGFHDGLLMLRRIPQLSLFDPGYKAGNWYSSSLPRPWDSYSQSFYDEIGLQGIASPEQDDIYNPIRAGKCELTYLSIVDAFGQTRNWPPSTDNLAIAVTFPDKTANVQNAAPAFLLPPRLAQASRLLFRWLSADDSGDVESNQHPATSPICGWLALNRVDETILVFEKDGALVGWIPAAGGPLTPLPGSSGVSDDSFLGKVVCQAEQSNCSLYDDIDTALLTIEPRSHRQHTARSVLVSRPLALARAALQLEVLGTPAPHQGYEWLASISSDPLPTDTYCPVTQPTGNISPFPQRETCGFTKVQFPVRLGDVSMDDDGLVAYWTLDSGALDSYCLVDSDPEAQSGVEPTIPLTCDPDPKIAPQQVLLLLDPRAPVHATSGILPTKEISIPPEMFTAAIQRMELLFTVGPVLTPPDQILMPMPTEVNGKWNWIMNEGNVIIHQGDAPSNGNPGFSGKSDDRAHLTPQPPVIRDGWLQVMNVEGGE